MPQNRESGAAANKYGHALASVIARRLGTELLSEKSNEIELSGERLVIKCAHRNVPQIGLSLSMLRRVDGIIAAIEQKKGKYVLYRVSPNWYKGNMKPSRSTRPSARKVMMVSCKSVMNTGRFIKAISCLL